MVERGQHLRFAPEPRESIRIGRDRRGEHLQRDVASELAVAGSIDFAHSTCADDGQNLVRAQMGAGLKRHPPSIATYDRYDGYDRYDRYQERAGAGQLSF